MLKNTFMTFCTCVLSCLKAQLCDHFGHGTEGRVVWVFLCVYLHTLSFILCNGRSRTACWLKSGILWDEMIWAEAPKASRGLLLLSLLSSYVLLSVCAAYCIWTLKSHCSLSLSVSLYLSPLFLSLFSPSLFPVAFDAFTFYEWFSLAPASSWIPFLCVKQRVFLLSNDADKLQLVKCHFPCLRPFWASFPSCSSRRFTFNCASNMPRVHQCSAVTVGGRKRLKYFPGFGSFMCIICVYIPHCVTTNYERYDRVTVQNKTEGKTAFVKK